MKTDILRQILTQEYGLHAPTIAPIDRGYTNQSFRVSAGGEFFVLRCGWAGKTRDQALHEELVLAYLARHPIEFGVPRVVPTTNGAPHLRVREQTFHLYTEVPGTVLYSWKDRCSDIHFAKLIRSLSGLHRALLPLSVGPAVGPLASYEQQIADLNALESTQNISATTSIRELLKEKRSEFIVRAREIIARAKVRRITKGSLVWCHGDFQLENVLFDGEQLVGLVDFDTVRALPLAMDTAFALFALSRDGAWDGGFRWDRERWHLGAEAYDGDLGEALVDTDWHELFCLDQALLHLRAGLRSIWQLDQGIGFVAAFRGVLAV